MPRSGIILCSRRQMEKWLKECAQKEAAEEWILKWENTIPEEERVSIMQAALDHFKREGQTAYADDVALHIYIQVNGCKPKIPIADGDASQDVPSSPGQPPSDSNDCQSQDEHDPSTL